MLLPKDASQASCTHLDSMRAKQHPWERLCSSEQSQSKTPPHRCSLRAAYNSSWWDDTSNLSAQLVIRGSVVQACSTAARGLLEYALRLCMSTAARCTGRGWQAAWRMWTATSLCSCGTSSAPRWWAPACACMPQNPKMTACSKLGHAGFCMLYKPEVSCRACGVAITHRRCLSHYIAACALCHIVLGSMRLS